MIGSFYQPKIVISDSLFLKTLQEEKLSVDTAKFLNIP